MRSFFSVPRDESISLEKGTIILQPFIFQPFTRTRLLPCRGLLRPGWEISLWFCILLIEFLRIPLPIIEYNYRMWSKYSSATSFFLFHICKYCTNPKLELKEEHQCWHQWFMMVGFRIEMTIIVTLWENVPPDNVWPMGPGHIVMTIPIVEIHNKQQSANFTPENWILTDLSDNKESKYLALSARHPGGTTRAKYY